MLVPLFGCGGGSAEPSKAPSAAPSQAPAASSEAPAATAAAVSTDDYVVYTIGVTDYLGRFIQGLTPSECPSACYAVFDQVFNPDPITKEIVSDCLEDWYWEDDTTFVMKLKENIVFSNGDKATAEDLLYSYTSFVDRGATTLDDFGLIFDQCVTRDDYTVQLKFEKPYRLVVNTRVNLINKAWSESVGWDSLEWYKPVCSGPYECYDFGSEDHIYMKARDNYWNAAEVGPIYVDEWKIQYYKDTATMNMDLEVGKIDFAEVQATDYSRYLKDGGTGYECFMTQSGTVQYVSFDFTGTDVWREKRLRQAVAHGVNWDQLGTVAFQDLFVPADSIAPKASPYHITPGVYEYDVEKAKALVEECGYSVDNPVVVKAKTMDSQLFKALSEDFQFQLSQIGIDYQVEFVDIATAIQAWGIPGEVDVSFWWNINGSPTFDLYDTMPFARRMATVWVYRDDPKFVELYEKMTYSTDEKVWGQAIKDMQQYVFDEVLYIPYLEMSGAFGYRTDRITEEQFRKGLVFVNMYQLDTLGYLSTWQ
jgi:ABC-type transport system substrate-binding protein